MLNVKSSAAPGRLAVTPQQHFGYIDALRGVALLAVLAFHLGYTVHGLPGLLSDALGRGYAGVQLFFVVSCFTLCTSLTARQADEAALGAYFVRRVFRIAPMFWFAIGLYIFLCGPQGGWSAPDGADPIHIALSALLLHGFNVNAVNGVVPGGWSVATEVQFYLILPLLVVLATTLRRALAIWLVALVISVIGPPAIEHALAPFYSAAQQGLVHDFAFYTLPAQLPVFASGLVLFRLMGPDRATLSRIEQRLPSSRRLRQATVFAFVLVVGLPLNLTSAVPSLIRTFPGHIGYGILGAMLVYAFAIYPKDTAIQRVLRFVGRISYSAYILHFAILDAVVRAMPASLISQPVLYLLILASIIVPLTCAAAWLTYMLIEKLGIALGHRLIRWLATRRGSPVLEPAPEALLGQGAR